MQQKMFHNEFKEDVNLYIEHKWVKKYVCPSERRYIIIAYIAYGEGSVIVNNQTFDVCSKDIFVANPGVKIEFISHNTSAENYNFEIHFILFEQDFLQGEWKKYAEDFVELESFFHNTGEGYIKVEDNDRNEIRNYIVRMTNEYYENAPARNSALFGQFLSLLPIIFRRYNIRGEQLFSKNTLVDQTIRQIRSTIYSNPKPSEIANHRFVTADYLGRVFKQETGMTITQYINHLRVEITKDILQNTDRPIEHIPMVFHITLKYLQQIFKKYTGISMREYRARHHYR